MLAAFTTAAKEVPASSVARLLHRAWPQREEKEVRRAVDVLGQHHLVITAQAPNGATLQPLHAALIDFALALMFQRGDPPDWLIARREVEQVLGDWVGLQEDAARAVERAVAQARAVGRPGLIADLLIANEGSLDRASYAAAWRALGTWLTPTVPRAMRDDAATVLARLTGPPADRAIGAGLLRTLEQQAPALVDRVAEALREGRFGPRTLQKLIRAEKWRSRRKQTTETLLSVDVSLENSPSITIVDEEQAPNEVLLARVSDENLLATKRRKAIVLLAWRGVRDVLPSLRQLIISRAVADDVQGAAAWAVGKLGDAAALEDLLGLLGDVKVDPITRAAAATSLGQIGDARAVEALAAALGDKDAPANIRGSAATALGRIGDETALIPLRFTIEDAHAAPRLRVAAIAGYVAGARDAPDWLIQVAMPARPAARAPPAVRGRILQAGREAGQGEEWSAWFRKAARFDTSFENRTLAVDALAERGALDEATIRYLIDPDFERRDGRRRDTDRGVCGVCAAAVLRRFAGGGTTEPALIDLVFDMLAEAGTHFTTIATALKPLSDLSPADATRALAELDSRLAARQDPVNPMLIQRLERQRPSIACRRAWLDDADAFYRAPEEVLRCFYPDEEVLMPAAASTTRRALLITATHRERIAVLQALQDKYGLPSQIAAVHGHLVDSFNWPCAAGASWQVTVAQPSDKGPLPTQALVANFVSATEPPSLVFMIGCCAGLPERKVAIGDVIFARRVHGYQRRRHESGRIGIATDPYPIEARLGELVNFTLTRPDFAARIGYSVHYKDFASAEDLIDDPTSALRESIADLSTEIVGFEMEGQGLAHSLWQARRRRETTVGAVIKGVSDFGDGHMAEDKAARQATATWNALEVALELLRSHPDAS